MRFFALISCVQLMFNALSYLATIVFFQIWSRGSRTVQEIFILNGLNAPRDNVEQNFLISKFWLYLQTKSTDRQKLGWFHKCYVKWHRYTNCFFSVGALPSIWVRILAFCNFGLESHQLVLNGVQAFSHHEVMLWLEEKITTNNSK